MPDRRTFLITCGGVVAAPALAHLGLPLAGVRPAASQAAAPATLVLRIDGWDTPDASDPAAHSGVWVHINSSWRAAWR